MPTILEPYRLYLQIRFKFENESINAYQLHSRVPKHVTKVEINVYTEDNVKQTPVIDLSSSTESIGE